MINNILLLLPGHSAQTWMFQALDTVYDSLRMDGKLMP